MQIFNSTTLEKSVYSTDITWKSFRNVKLTLSLIIILLMLQIVCDAGILCMSNFLSLGKMFSFNHSLQTELKMNV